MPVEGWITLDKAKELFAARARISIRSRRRRRTKDFKPVALNAKATFDVKIDVAQDPVAERRREARGHATRRTNTSSTPRTGTTSARTRRSRATRSTTARWTTRQRQLGAARDREGVHEAADAAEALDPVPLGHGGGEGARRREVLRDASAVSARQDGREHQHRRHQPVGKDERLHRDRARQLDARRRSARACSRRTNRTVRPDAEPEKGFYYRSDHFEFAKQGVPALDTDAGIDFIGKPAGYGMQKRDEYTNNDYHKPFRRSEARLGFQRRRAGHAARCSRSATAWRRRPTIPQWKPGTEFKAKRDSMMAAQDRCAEVRRVEEAVNRHRGAVRRLGASRSADSRRSAQHRQRRLDLARDAARARAAARAVSPRWSSSSSAVKPGPSVASSNSTPPGSRK